MKLIVLFFGCLFFIACNQKGNKPESKSHNNPDKNEHKQEQSLLKKDEFTPLNYVATFLGEDSLQVTYQLAEVSEKAPYILLCHQAGYSRGEYIESIKTFNELGYNALALDQRSGNEANGIINETAKKADSLGLDQSYLAAEKDIRSAITLIDQLSSNDIILLGSSYSASLVLKIAADKGFPYRNRIKAVIAFSPGEYLKNYELSPTLNNISCPVFMTAAKNEMAQIKMLSKNISTEFLTLYQPETESKHGSSALWDETDGSKACWDALSAFLFQLKN